MFHYFLWNPAAGKRRQEELRRRIVAFAQGQGLDFLLEESRPDGSIAQQCRRMVMAHPEGITLYACGGDGTISAAAQGAAGLNHARITQIPCGSGNDFLRLFGDTAPRFADLSAQLGGRDITLDLIETGPGRRALNVCSAGLDARVNADVDWYKRLPLVSAGLAYRMSLAVNFVKGLHKPMEVELDGKCLRGEVTLAACCNGQFYGSNFRPVPEASPEDGALDFLVIGPVERRHALPLIRLFESGQWRKLGDKACYVRGKRMTLRSPVPMPVNLDGETLWQREVTFSLAPDRVRFHLPEGALPVWKKPEETEEIGTLTVK